MVEEGKDDFKVGGASERKHEEKRKGKILLIKGQAEGIIWEKIEERLGAEADHTSAKLKH